MVDMCFNRTLACALHAVLASLLVCTPAIARNGSCFFRVNADLKLNFGALDPSSIAVATTPVVAATVGSDDVGDCRNVTMTVKARTGTVLQMTNGTGGVIPYSLTTYSAAAPGNNRYSQLVLQGSITPANYQNAPAGSYTQTNVFLDVTP